jgi:hypothetical protein
MVTIQHQKKAGDSRSTRSTLWALRLLLAAALLALTLVAALPVVPPQAVPADVSDSTFSAERAMQDLEMVAAVPHPTGSAAQQRVREYLVAQAEGLACRPRSSRTLAAARRT